jgi:NitT/TauT family transport system substrate-binding protein
MSIAVRLSLAMLAIAAAGTLRSLPAAAQGPEMKEIRFVGVPSAGSALVWIAHDKGFDKEEGFEFKPAADLAAGLVTDNVLSGRADAAYGGITTMINAYSKGAPLALIVNHDFGTEWELLVHADSPYRSLKDLEGKTVSVIAANSICVLALRRAFELDGLAKDHVKFTVVAPPDQVAAFGAKRVDASCMFDPMRLQMRTRFGGRPIWSILDPRYNVAQSLGGGLVMHRDVIAKNPRTVAAIQRAIDKAAKAANADRDVVFQALAKATKQSVENLREISLPTYASPPSLRQGNKDMADLLLKYGFFKEPIDLAAFDLTPTSVPAR